jgi:multidrug resistance efflux pump
MDIPTAERELAAARAKVEKCEQHLAGAKQAVVDAEAALQAAKASPPEVFEPPTESVQVHPDVATGSGEAGSVG